MKLPVKVTDLPYSSMQVEVVERPFPKLCRVCKSNNKPHEQRHYKTLLSEERNANGTRAPHVRFWCYACHYELGTMPQPNDQDEEEPETYGAPTRS